MCAIALLSSALLRQVSSPEDIPFETSSTFSNHDTAFVGQERALEALHFGIGIERPGYHVVAIGPPGLGKESILRGFLEDQASHQSPGTDLCYVHNFADPERPTPLALPPGLGAQLQRDLAHAVGEMRLLIRAAMESDEYHTRKKAMVDELKRKQHGALAAAQEYAKSHHVAVFQTESGFGVAPIYEGRVLDTDAFQALPKEAQEALRLELDHVGLELQSLLRRYNEWGREHDAALKALQAEMAGAVARRVLDSLRATYQKVPAVITHLAEIERDVGESVEEFLESVSQGVEATLRRALRQSPGDGPSFRRYQVNVMVDRSEAKAAPVIYEDHPTYANLVGRVEHETHFGALVTNFLLMKAGAFHRAIGGYLVLDALKVLQQPLAWDALKRTLQSAQIRMESLGQAIGLVPTVSLDPVPTSLGSTKVVLISDRSLYYLLAAWDPDFLKLFKVLVDFDDSMDRRPETAANFAQLLAALVQKEGLRPFDRSAMARVIDHAARLAGDRDKLSVHRRSIVDLLMEADHASSVAKRDLVTAEDVDCAINQRRARAGRVRRLLQEAVRREDQLIATSGEVMGQVNGLAVFQLGEDLFGHPTRITARTHLGKGEVLDIEREVTLGGPIHSKGIMILSGFLGGRYLSHMPLALSATLVFEQSYGVVDGDSASLAELCALLSSLAEVPVKQAIAVTGSINQQGEVQSVGGINEKIEGFFAVCADHGLTGDQGVVIPRTNAKNLMLDPSVIKAVDQGLFKVYTVAHVDDAMELLTGLSAGARDFAGHYAEGTLNARVEARLAKFLENARLTTAKEGYVTAGGRWTTASFSGGHGAQGGTLGAVETSETAGQGSK